MFDATRRLITLAMSMLLAVGCAGVPARASAEAAPAAMAANPSFLGQWQLDLSRMPPDYGTLPQRVVYSFEDAGAGEWRTKIDITMADGGVRHVAVRYRRDGRVAQSEGDTAEGERAALSSPAADVLVMSLAKDKALGSVRVYTLSADGREMTESAANVDEGGMPFVRTFHFRRIG